MKISLFGKKKKDPVFNPTAEADPTNFMISLNNETANLNEEIPDTQFKLGIKESKLEPVFKVRRSISKIELTAEAIPFWKNTVSIIALTFSIIALLVSTFLIYYYYPQFPGEMPLFYDHGNQRWLLYNKSIYLIFPAVLAIPLLLLWRVNYSVFFFDKRLAMVVTWIVLLFSILSLVGVSEILSLILL